MVSFGNSIKISSLTAVITTVLTFALAYAINCTNIYKPLKTAIKAGILIPMLLPTITYGFAIIYSFGNQGLLTKILGENLFAIYGFNGLLIGYIIYTLPAAFLLINNSFKYIDKKFIVVSKLMGDGTIRSFKNTIVRPLLGLWVALLSYFYLELYWFRNTGLDRRDVYGCGNAIISSDAWCDPRL